MSNLVSHFGFSAVSIDDLEASEYTLVTIACDISSSVDSFKNEMEKCLQEIVGACSKSPRADNLMLRLVLFSDQIYEHHGFKPLPECKPNDYHGILKPHGMTALCDASLDAIQALDAYGKQLMQNDYDVNGILVVITDGMDNASTKGSLSNVAQAIKGVEANESMESLVTIVVGISHGCSEYDQYLADFEKDGQFSQSVGLEDANVDVLSKLAKFVSKSISSQSQALGTGGPSRRLLF